MKKLLKYSQFKRDEPEWSFSVPSESIMNFSWRRYIQSISYFLPQINFTITMEFVVVNIYCKSG